MLVVLIFTKNPDFRLEYKCSGFFKSSLRADSPAGRSLVKSLPSCSQAISYSVKLIPNHRNLFLSAFYLFIYLFIYNNFIWIGNWKNKSINANRVPTGKNQTDRVNLAIDRVVSCVSASEISCWMEQNDLKLNQDKTDILLIHPRFREGPALDYLQFRDERISISDKVTNLGVILDNHLAFDDQVDHVFKLSINHLRNLFRIGHVRYINILTWLRGFQANGLYLVLFSLYLSLIWEVRDKGNLKNLQF